jgi:YggT family protein
MPMFPLLSLVDLLIDALILLIFVYSILSWFRHDPRNPIIRIVNGIVEPLLHPIRAIMPALGPVDLSPMIAMLVLWLLRNLLRGAV